MKLCLIVSMLLLLASCLVEGENPNRTKNFGGESVDEDTSESREEPTDLFHIFWAESDEEDNLKDKLFAVWLDTEGNDMSIMPIDWDSRRKKYKALKNRGNKKGNCVDHFPNAMRMSNYGNIVYNGDKGRSHNRKKLKIHYRLGDDGLPTTMQVEYSGPDKNYNTVTYYTKPAKHFTKAQRAKINNFTGKNIKNIKNIFGDLDPCDERSRSEEIPDAVPFSPR